MKALHFAVQKRPTIEESTTEILRAIEGFESVVHFHGTDGKFLKSLGNKKPVIDLGKVIHRFLLPPQEHEGIQRALQNRPSGCLRASRWRVEKSTSFAERRSDAARLLQWIRQPSRGAAAAGPRREGTRGPDNRQPGLIPGVSLFLTRILTAYGGAKQSGRRGKVAREQEN